MLKYLQSMIKFLFKLLRQEKYKREKTLTSDPRQEDLIAAGREQFKKLSKIGLSIPIATF